MFELFLLEKFIRTKLESNFWRGSIAMGQFSIRLQAWWAPIELDPALGIFAASLIFFPFIINKSISCLTEAFIAYYNSLCSLYVQLAYLIPVFISGMGLERLTACCNEMKSNYEIQAFKEIFDSIAELSHQRPYSNKYGAEDADQVDMAYRVVADHLRTLVISMSDGVLPNNNGRG